jgi:hypothetical protein
MRLNKELINLIDLVFKQKNINFSSINNKVIWTYIFQLECVRATQYEKLMFTTDTVNLVSLEIFSYIRLKNVLKTNKYSFNLYLSKIGLILKKVICDFPSTLNNSVLPLDLSLRLSFLEFRKRIFLLSNILNADLNKNAVSYKNILRGEKNLLKASINYKEAFFSKKKSFFIDFFLSSKFSLVKLNSLGIINSLTKRVTSVSNLVVFEDFYILRFFGYLAHSFLIWFRCCKDFSKVKNLINVIRQSCYLTLSRKHNKTKSWAYKVYTFDLIITLSLFTNESYFPTKKFLLKIKRHFFFLRYEIFFDEVFFLT